MQPAGGGAFILVGLSMEKYAGKQPSFTKRSKAIEDWGEWLVIFGVFIEILSTGAFAIRGEIEYKQRAPKNLPIRSVAADVNLVLRGTNVLYTLNNLHPKSSPLPLWWWDSLAKKQNLLVLVGKTNNLMMLLSDDIDWMGEPKFSKNTEKEIVSIHFSWPSENAWEYAISHADEVIAEKQMSITTNSNVIFPLSAKSMSTSDFDQQIKGAECLGVIIGVEGSNVISGSCDVTFNGLINRHFVYKSNFLQMVFFIPVASKDQN